MACGTHLKALLKKNWILWKRSCCCSILEIVIPCLFILGLLGIRRLVDTEDIPKKSYVANELYDYSIPSFLNIANDPKQTPRVLSEEALHHERMLDIVRPFIRNCKTSERRNGALGLAPDNFITRELEKYFRPSLDVRFFKDNEDLNRYIESGEYGTDTNLYPFLCFCLVMKESENGNYRYHIRFNTTGPMDDVYDTSSIEGRTIALKVEDWDASKGYLDNGFIRLQTLVDNIILKKDTGKADALINVKTSSLPVPAFYQDDLPTYLQGSTNIYIVLPMILIFLRVIYRVLYEKERKIREGMKMMGMNDSSFYLSWIITYVIIFTVISIIEAILLRASIMKKSNGFIVWVWIWLFLMCLLFQALFVSVFFTRTKSGLIAGFLFFFLLYIINAIVGTNEVPDSTKVWASLSSHAAMAFSADSFLVAEARQGGITPETARIKINGYAVSTSIGFFILNIAFYGLSFIYLDQVFPNEFGRKKHPLFFLDCCLKRNKDKRAKITPQNEEADDMKNKKENVEEVDAGLKELELQNQCIAIRNLFKKYPNGKKAVNDLSLTMYNSQIFALLGHNGAGKTTTISMLTGMIDITSGSAKIGSYDVQTEMETIRKSLGVCPQHDILFGDLTVKEHLELFATFKGMNPKEIPDAVEKIIADLDFIEKKNYLSKNLSGGQKRKLSVGIAFIGGSKIILLDEPTSGMDTSARRHIWEILKNYKQDKIVILTTHFMDEADFLGDRIAIMGEGELKCCGSSVFLKNKFGVGYNLILVKAEMSHNPRIPEFINRHVPEARLLSDVSAEISFQLPLTAVSKFKNLFENLDKSLKDLGILSYGISITTLEEVFLKIAEGDIKKEAHDFQKEESLKAHKNEIDNFDLNSVRIRSPIKLFFIHFWALLLKKIQYYKRDKKGLMCEIMMPIIMITVGLGIMTIKFVIESPALEMLPNLYSTPLPTVYSGSADPNTMMALLEKMDSRIKLSYTSQSSAADWDNYLFDNRRSDQRGSYFIQEIDRNRQVYSYISLFNTTSPDSVSVFINRMNEAILKYATGNNQISLVAVNEPMPLTRTSKSIENTADGFIGAIIFVIALAFIPASLIVYIIKERQYNVKHQQMVSGVSLFAYWMSNFCVDIVKYLIPAIWGAVMCKAFSITSMIEDDNWGVTWLLFILYGFAVIPFTYLSSFLFNDYGAGQLASFFFNMIVGCIINIVMWVLRIIPSSRNFAKQFHFFLRICPSFSFGYGILNISNRSLYAAVEGYRVKKDAFDYDIAGYDLLYLGIFCVIYFILIFLVEKLLTVPSFNKIFSREDKIQYQPHPYDDDVAEEFKLMSRQGDEKEYTIKVQELRKVFVLNRNLSKVAVDRVSFGIKNGECFGLLGINGAGKTTTFKMLCGEVMPTSGKAYIVGYDLSSNIREARNYIGYCPQFDALLDNLTSREHLYLYAALKGIPANMRKELVEKKIDEMGLRQYADVISSTYSGGNKRKLSVAIAMLGNPPIVFLDEPSTGMDPHARRFMWDVISRISTLRKSSSVILTTHSMEEAEALSTKIAIMVNGEFKCLGSIQHIKNKFGKGYEIEVKTQVPSPVEIDSVLARLGMPRGSRVALTRIEELLGRLGAIHLNEEISPKGSGSSLFLELRKPLGLAVEMLAEYFIIQSEYGPRIMNFLRTQLGNFSIIEHFQNFYRFKLDTNISIGSVFGTFEENKNQLKISQYSVRQATIEQIFNMFATGQIKDLTPEEKEAVKLKAKKASISERPTSGGQKRGTQMEMVPDYEAK